MPAPLIEFPADDATRARRFWSGVLGVELATRPPAAGSGWEADADGLRLGVHERGRGPGDTASLPYFTVADLATTTERVRELGGSVIHPGERWAICRDSEGSPFALAASEAETETLPLEALLDAFNAHDLDAIMAFFTEDCVFDTPRGPAPGGHRLVGKAQVRKGFQARFEGIPDIEYGQGRHWTCGDRGVSEWTIRGTQSTGESIEVRGCDLFELTEGKISRKDSFWKIVD